MLSSRLYASLLAAVTSMSLLQGAAAAMPLAPTASPAESRHVPRASTFPLQPLLTGGILETSRQITLNQSVSVRQTEPEEGCNDYADGQVAVNETSRVSGLIDLGYTDVPRADPEAPTTLLQQDTSVSGSVTTQGGAWACPTSDGAPVLAQGGTCTRNFTTSPDSSFLIVPQRTEMYGEPYETGVSKTVVGVTYYDAGIDCVMEQGQLSPWAPGLFMYDWWGDAQYYSAFPIPGEIAVKDKGTAQANMAKSDTSCVSGSRWWENEHGSSIYVWTGQDGSGETPDWITSTCSSVRSGTASTSVQRALVVEEVSVKQMSPSGGYVDVGPSDKVVDGNTVKIEMLITNRWKRDITVPISMWDSTGKATLEPEKGQQNPVTETFVAGARKKVSFTWRTDGIAWDYQAAAVKSRDLDIRTPYGGARFTLLVQPRPALLVHGWNSSAATWDAWPGYVKATRDDWYVKAVTGMDTDPRTGTTIQDNATKVASAVRDARSATGAVHVDLVVHSMGGLISRYYLTNLMGGPAEDGRHIIRSLTMFGTPHLGSDCATMILAHRNGELLSLIPGGTLGILASKWAADWSARGAWIPTIQLTPAYLTGPFMGLTRRVNGIHYSHLSGIPLSSFACEGFGSQSGPNDSAVVLPSSLGGGLGGKALAAPMPVWHVNVPGSPGMTGFRGFYDLTLLQVLGLAPDTAPRLVGAAGPASRAATSSKTASRAVVHATASGSVGDKLTLVKPAGAYSLVVNAPTNSTVSVMGPQGPLLTDQPGGVPLRAELGSESGSITITTSGTGESEVTASLIDTTSWFDVTTKRQGRRLLVSVTVPDKKPTRLEATTVSNGVVGKIARLSGTSRHLKTTLRVAKGDAVLVIVRGARGESSRYVVTGG